MSFVVKSDFIGCFKNGDNIAHNFAVLDLLYKYFNEETDQNKNLLCKPIVINIVSIIEALLDDLYFRIKNLRVEGVPGLNMQVLHKIRYEITRDKRFFKFENYIKNAYRNNLFNQQIGFYRRMNSLRKLRNRIHIQNKYGYAELDEAAAFNVNRKESAEKVCEIILRKLERKHGRGKWYHYVSDFTVPWEQHFTVIANTRSQMNTKSLKGLEE